MNSERLLVKLVREICLEDSIELTTFSYDWILRLQKGDRQGFIFGYNFGINNSASTRICDDKSAVSDILLNNGIPVIEHTFFISPTEQHYVGENGSWQKIRDMLTEYGALVCKANEGTGGRNIFLVRDHVELESAVLKIFSNRRGMAICPFYDIIKEYRVIVLCGEVKLIYAKNIPFLVGNGKSSIRQLLLDFLLNAEFKTSFKQLADIIDNAGIRHGDEVLDQVLSTGDIWSINWKSNLALGASPEIVTNPELLDELSRLALNAANAVSIDFASIDIVNTPKGLRVLEINSGIMMEHFARSKAENYFIAKEIYRDAVFALMG